MNKSKQLTEGALLTAIFVVLILISVFVPVISLLASLLLSVPFIIFAARHGWRPSLIMLVAAILLAILFATVYAFPVALMAGIGGIMIGTAINHERSPYETWARGTLGYVIGILFIFLFALLFLDVNVIDEMNKEMDQTIEKSKQIVSEFGMGMESEEQFALIEQQLAVYKQLVPFGIVFMGLLLALLNQWIGYKILNRLEQRKLNFPKFRNLRFPPAIIWIYLFAILFSFILKDPNETFFIAVQNIIMLIGFFLVLQGFSFVFFFVHQKHLSIAIPVIVIVLSVVFAPLLLPLIRILGIIDIGFGLRNQMVKKP